jgi:hypothetical protein
MTSRETRSVAFAGAATPAALGAVSTVVKPTLSVIMPRGETFRNFVYTGALDRVAESVDLDLLSVFPTPDLEALLRSRYRNVTELAKVDEKFTVNYLREILDMAHQRRVWSQAAIERWKLRDIEANTTGKKLKRIANKAVSRLFAHRPGLEFLDGLERSASRAFRTTEIFLQHFERTKPALVFNGSHIHSRNSIAAVQAAKWLGIPTAAFCFSWDNLTSQGRVIPQHDYYLVWNEGIKRTLLDHYPKTKAENVFVTGTPQFDFHYRKEFYWSREEFCQRIGADPNRPIVLYSTGMANHVAHEPRTVEDIADMLKGMTDLGPPQLVVREYAKGPAGLYADLKMRRKDILFPKTDWELNWLTPKLEDCYLLTNMLRHCAVGINVASTISLELCMFDKPCINVNYLPPGFDYYFDYRAYYQYERRLSPAAVSPSRAVRRKWRRKSASISRSRRRTRRIASNSSRTSSEATSTVMCQTGLRNAWLS